MNGKSHTNGYSITNGHSLKDEAPKRPAPPRRATDPDEDLFDAAADLLASAGQEKTEDKAPEPDAKDAPLELGKTVDPKDPNPVTLRRRFDDVKEEPAAPPHPLRRATDFLQAEAGAAAATPAPETKPAAAEPPPAVVTPPASKGL